MANFWSREDASLSTLMAIAILLAGWSLEVQSEGYERSAATSNSSLDETALETKGPSNWLTKSRPLQDQENQHLHNQSISEQDRKRSLNKLHTEMRSNANGNATLLRQPRATTKKHPPSTTEIEGQVTTDSSTTVPLEPEENDVRANRRLKSTNLEERTTERTLDDESEDELREALRRRKLKHRIRQPDPDISIGGDGLPRVSSNSSSGSDEVFRQRKPAPPASIQKNSNRKLIQGDNNSDDLEYNAGGLIKSNKSPLGRLPLHSNLTALNETSQSLNATNYSGQESSIPTTDGLDARYQPISKRLNNILVDQRSRLNRHQTPTRSKPDTIDQSSLSETMPVVSSAKGEPRNDSLENLDWSKLVKVVFKGSNDNQTIYTVVVNSSELSNHPINDWTNELPTLLRRDFEKLIRKWSNIFPMSKLMGDLGKIIVQNITAVTTPVNGSIPLEPLARVSHQLKSANITTLMNEFENSTRLAPVMNQSIAIETNLQPDPPFRANKLNSTNTAKTNLTASPSQVVERGNDPMSPVPVDIDYIKEKVNSLKHFIIICSVVVVLATSLAVFLINILLK